MHDPRRRPVVGHRDPPDDQVPQPAADDLGVVAETAARRRCCTSWRRAARTASCSRPTTPCCRCSAVSAKPPPSTSPTRSAEAWLYDNADAFFFGRNPAGRPPTETEDAWLSPSATNATREKPQQIADELRGADRLGRTVGRRLARARTGPGRALRRVAPVAARGAADPRSRRAHHRRARRARRRHRARARRPHDRAHRGAGAPSPQRLARRRLRGEKPARADRGAHASQPCAVARAAVKELRVLVRDEEDAIEDPERFGAANAAFHQRLVAAGGKPDA